ncbi:sensor histidine kinase [Pseudonocardiaceae bacterium YIM PH 21723]|nr:sensor histidine kinase [Pseudonocardiaceae bacterium YIM PH 21723]
MPDWLRGMLGLRGRLIAAFLLIAVGGTATIALVNYSRTKDTLLQQAQNNAVRTVRQQLNQVAGTIAYPPNEDTLLTIQEAVLSGAPNTQVMVVYKDLKVDSGGVNEQVTGDMRQAVGGGGFAYFQRVGTSTVPRLVIGMPLQSDDYQSTGIEVYTLHSLRVGDQRSENVAGTIEGVASTSLQTALITTLIAALLALLAAQGVLRPVRAMRQVANELADGDLSARMQVRGSDELADLSRTVNEMAETLEYNVEHLRRMEAGARRFAADVSHELRTPLAAMVAVTEILETDDPRLPPETQASAQLVARETKNMARLVEDLMEISRFDAGSAALRLEECDVAQAIKGALGVRGWQQQVVGSLPAGVIAQIDRRRLDVIVANLVGNALKHGGSPVHLDLRVVGRYLEFAVTDNGPGMSEEVLPHVFDRFYKADTARTRSVGSGLGLAIALENAMLHGGRITANNVQPNGARFVLYLPLQARPPKEERP